MIGDVARRLLESVEVEDGVRLLGIGMSSLAEVVQQDLFDWPATAGSLAQEVPAEDKPAVRWFLGCDFVHDRHGRRWVERIEKDVLTVRFETPISPPGIARRLPKAHQALHLAPPPS